MVKKKIKQIISPMKFNPMTYNFDPELPLIKGRSKIKTKRNWWAFWYIIIALVILIFLLFLTLKNLF